MHVGAVNAFLEKVLLDPKRGSDARNFPDPCRKELTTHSSLRRIHQR